MDKDYSHYQVAVEVGRNPLIIGNLLHSGDRKSPPKYDNGGKWRNSRHDATAHTWPGAYSYTPRGDWTGRGG